MRNENSWLWEKKNLVIGCILVFFCLDTKAVQIVINNYIRQSKAIWLYNIVLPCSVQTILFFNLIKFERLTTTETIRNEIACIIKWVMQFEFKFQPVNPKERTPMDIWQNFFNMDSMWLNAKLILVFVSIDWYYIGCDGIHIKSHFLGNASDSLYIFNWNK